MLLCPSAKKYLLLFHHCDLCPSCFYCKCHSSLVNAHALVSGSLTLITYFLLKLSSQHDPTLCFVSASIPITSEAVISELTFKKEDVFNASFLQCKKYFLNMIFSGLLASDMDVGRKFSLQWLYNGALFPYLPLVKQPRSQLTNLFSKVSNAERSNHPTPLWLHF